MSDSEKRQFIEVKRVVSEDGSRINTGTSPETIDVKDVVSFRPWRKSKNDDAISGEMTHVILSTMLPDKESGKMKSKTILIEESYNSFSGRMAGMVNIRQCQQ